MNLVLILILALMASAWFANWIVRVRPAKKAIKIVARGQIWQDKEGSKWRIVCVDDYTLSAAFCLDELGADKGTLICPVHYITKFHTRVP